MMQFAWIFSHYLSVSSCFIRYIFAETGIATVNSFSNSSYSHRYMAISDRGALNFRFCFEFPSKLDGEIMVITLLAAGSRNSM